MRGRQKSLIAGANLCFGTDEGNSSSRKTRQQVAHAQSLQWQAELAQAEEAMRINWPPKRQSPTLQLVAQVQEANGSGHWQNANVETFGKKGKERIQRGHPGCCFCQEEEQIRLNVFGFAVCTPKTSADETTRMSTKDESSVRRIEASERNAATSALMRPIQAMANALQVSRRGGRFVQATSTTAAIFVVRRCLSFSLSLNY